jgi:hypothetical protein
MKIGFFLIFIFTNFAAAECRENIVAKCGSMQIVHKLCGNASGSYRNEKYALIDDDGKKMGFYLRDGLLTSPLWKSKKHISYGLNIHHKFDGGSEFALQPLGSKAEPIDCETLNFKNDSQTQTAHESADESSAAR